MVYDATAGLVDLDEQFALISDPWVTHVVARVNDQAVNVLTARGQFGWDVHPAADELFLVIEGELTVQLRDRDVVLRPGQLFVVPRGVEHAAWADAEVRAILVEPTAPTNTGAADEHPTRYTDCEDNDAP